MSPGENPRPPTEEEIIRICSIVRVGVDYSTATTANGIEPFLSSFWLIEAEKDDCDELIKKLAWEYHQAVAQSKVLMVEKLIAEGGASGVKWLLEKNFPDEYGKKVTKKAKRKMIPPVDFIELDL